MALRKSIRAKAFELLGLELADALTAGYDAVRNGPDGPVYIQIKGRAYGDDAKPWQRLCRIKIDAHCDIGGLVAMRRVALSAFRTEIPPTLPCHFPDHSVFPRRTAAVVQALL